MAAQTKVTPAEEAPVESVEEQAARYEEFDRITPDGKTAHIRRNIDTGDQTVTIDDDEPEGDESDDEDGE